MALQICLRLDEKFNKFEHNFAGLGMEMAELHKEYAKLRAEIARKEVEHCGQIVVLENEVKKLREQNGILTSRLMNNATEEREHQQQIRPQNKRCRLVDIFPNVERVPRQQQQENEVLVNTGIHEQIPTTHHHAQPLEGSNNIENLANIQFTAPNNGVDNGIPIIKQEKDMVDIIGICPSTSAEQQHEIAPQQIVEQKQQYTANPLDELNETSADGFGQVEESAFDEEGDEIVAGTSMEMDGTSPTVREYLRERMDEFYGGDALAAQNEGPSNNSGIADEQGPSNVNIGQQDGQQSVRKKMKMKNLSVIDMPIPPIQYSFRMEMHLDNQLICQWPGCGYRRNAKYKSDMQRHWRTHTGERPYCCSICGQSFARLDNMKKHELTQHSLL